jgi:hypothetical protein
MHANDFCERAMQRHGDARLLGKLHARYDRIGYLPLQTGVCAFAAAWNKGKLIGQKAPLKLREIWGDTGSHATSPQSARSRAFQSRYRQ